MKANFKKNPIRIRKKVNKKTIDKEVKKEVVKDLKKIVRNSDKKTYFTRNQSQIAPKLHNYGLSLMYPEKYIAKVPRCFSATISMHRRVVINLACNASGALGLLWNPFSLSDTTTPTSTFFYDNDPGYVPSTSTIGVQPSAAAFGTAVTLNTVLGYRVVSASMIVTSQSSTLNNTGTMTCYVPKLPVAAGVTAGATVCPANLYSGFYLPSSVNDSSQKLINLSGNQAARSVWLPVDACAFEFININSNSYALATVTGIPYLSTVVTGAVPSSYFRIECFVNYEILPAQASSLQGLEYTNSDLTDPFLVLSEVSNKLYKQQVTAISANVVVPAMKLSIGQL
jgi:hypothetical protein